MTLTAQKATTKRIHSVTIKRMIDESPGTSWLGEYGNDAKSDFSIDRAHDLDCPAQAYNRPTETIDKLERAIAYLNSVYGDVIDSFEDMDAVNEAQDILVQAQDDMTECDCGRGEWHGREYRYFNPSFNYVDKQGHALPENTPEDVRKYVRQDYERMESLNNGQWCFIGIRAEAEYSVGEGVRGGHCLIQEVTSGGLWGIESDSEASYFAEVEAEELANLREQLAGIGFSKRAIAAAFKDVTRMDE